MHSLNSDLKTINRVGASAVKKLNKIGLATIEDLLFYFPARYEDRRQVSKIKDLKAGSAVAAGRIELLQNKRSPRKRMFITEALLNDGSARIKAIWFNQPFIAKNLRPGDTVSLAGKIEEDSFGDLVFMSPEYEKISNNQALHTQGLVPNYRLTSGLTQKQIRFLISQIIFLSSEIKDWLPKEIIKKHNFLSLGEAVKQMHFPKSFSDMEKAKKRLAFNELFRLQIRSGLIKKELKSARAEAIIFKEKATKNFVDSLPFKLTDSQRKSAWEILKDLEKNKPMNRLLEGDVGSGKTMVAIIAMLNTALNKKQAALMAPTEILARQHYRSLCDWLKNFNFKIGVLTGSFKQANFKPPTTGEKRKKTKADAIFPLSAILASDIIIGTQALIQERISFPRLSLVVIDEQHRFGVEQRKILSDKAKNKGLTPHFLSMTATPIPRSLALALYGDLDLSILSQQPANRKKIITRVVPEEKRQIAYDFIKKILKDGRQMFVVCPLIDISDKLGVKSAKQEYERLSRDVFPGLSIGIMHGRLKPKEKEKVMDDFIRNKIKILVSTSVIEVGVDIPNAVIMMIEGADRFGLAQLHQFRGRVGRGADQAYCFLFSESRSQKAINRLEALTNCYDGFALAKTDLKYRGPGEVYGLAQKGFPELKIASLFDYPLMKLAREEAENILKNKNLKAGEFLESLIENMDKEVHLE